jgi:dTDP-4-dehydrorhamnose 3,5-epimerase-like enzyme
VFYKCGAPYAPEHQINVHFADPQLSIDWVQFENDVVISEKDHQGISIVALLEILKN